MELTYFIVAGILLVVSVITLVVCAYKYAFYDAGYSVFTEKEWAKAFLFSLTGPVLAILWPISMSLGLAYGLWRMIRSARQTIKEPL